MLLLTVGLVWVVSGTLEVRIVNAGDTAPNFSIVTEHGKTVTRSDFGGKLLVLNFWASWCPPCITELPSLNQFATEYASQGVVVLGVSIDVDDDAYHRFLKLRKVNFLTVRDPEQKVATMYGTAGWPETYVIDRQGLMRRKFIGPVDWNSPEVEQFLSKL